jgi:hypothetical protein
MMRRLSVLLMIVALMLPFSLDAGIHGILKGKVTDDNGDGLVGATVQILGTSRGAMVNDPDGSYTVVNIVAGEYQVKFSMVGSGEVIKSVRISADKTTVLNVTLSNKDIAMEGFTVEANRELVNKTDIGNMTSYDSESITQTARQNVNAVVSLSAGVSSSGNGFVIRGSRSNNTQIRVDGMDVSNQFTGGYGATGSTYFPMVSSYAVSELQVLTGGFSAEYGEAMGGIVNTVVQTGRQDRYEGFIRWTTDVPALYGSQSSSIEVIREGNDLVPIETGEGATIMGNNRHDFEFGSGGPLPYIPKSTFYLTGSHKYREFSSASYDISDPWGNNWGQNANNRSWVKFIGGRLDFGLTQDIRLLVGLEWGMTNREIGSDTWEYMDMNGIIDGVDNGIPAYVAQLPVQNMDRSTIFAKINHTLTDKMFYEIRISNTTNNDGTTRRAQLDDLDPNFFTGFELLEPRDEYAVEGSNLVPGSDRIIDEFTPITVPGTPTEDGYYSADYAAINPLTGYVEGNVNGSGTHNPWGLPNRFPTYGSGSSISYRFGDYWQFKGDLTSLFESGEGKKKFSHTFKTGFDIRLFSMEKFQVSNPYDGNPFRDIYTDRFGGNIYTSNELGYSRTSKPTEPMKFAFYIQDQIDYQGIIISPGLRFDYFEPNSLYREGEDDLEEFISIDSEEGFADAESKFQVSPRINVSYPITATSILSINYGMYFKMPQLQYMYDGFGIDNLRGNSILGDPNMDAQRTNAYQIDYKQQLPNYMRFSIGAYYKDIYNQTGVKRVPKLPDPYYQYTTADYGNSKGIEFEFRKMPFEDNIGLDFNYTLAYVTGTSQSPAGNYNVALDPYTDFPMFPLATYPMGWDVRHTLKGTFKLVWNDNQGPSIGNIRLLENTLVAFTGVYQTGTPYSRTDQGGVRISDINALRNPDYWSLDLQISKAFMMKDIFGESAGNSRVEFFVNVYNLLNRTAAVGYYSTTSDPIDDGISLYREIGNFLNTAYYKEADLAIPESIRPGQYDDLGMRLYSVDSDFDNNGIVTQAEQYESYINYIEHLMKFKGQFQAPRTVYMGIMFNF